MNRFDYKPEVVVALALLVNLDDALAANAAREARVCSAAVGFTSGVESDVEGVLLAPEFAEGEVDVKDLASGARAVAAVGYGQGAHLDLARLLDVKTWNVEICCGSRSFDSTLYQRGFRVSTSSH